MTSEGKCCYLMKQTPARLTIKNLVVTLDLRRDHTSTHWDCRALKQSEAFIPPDHSPKRTAVTPRCSASSALKLPPPFPAIQASRSKDTQKPGTVLP